LRDRKGEREREGERGESKREEGWGGEGGAGEGGRGERECMGTSNRRCKRGKTFRVVFVFGFAPFICAVYPLGVSFIL